MRFKRAIKRLARAAGYNIQRRTTATDPALQLVASLRHFGIDFVVDVGANSGQYGLELREAGYDGRILSVEPLSSAYSKLEALASQDPRWTVCERCAVSDCDGYADIHIAENSVSSSLLPMTEAHLDASTESGYIGTERVELRRLDSILFPELTERNRVFLKIDSQGAEWSILDGASLTIDRIQGVQCELSIVELYEDQRLWLELIDRIMRCGFSLWSIRRGFTDLRNGRSLQFDATFFRL